jgi:hypothetical protein
MKSNLVPEIQKPRVDMDDQYEDVKNDKSQKINGRKKLPQP